MAHPTRYIYINDWSGIYDTEAKLHGVIDECDYMNCDAICIIVWSDYFEAVRNPAYSGWDSRASWDMVNNGIDYCHSKGMQFHVWVPINYSNSTRRAEQRLFGTMYHVVRRGGSIHPSRNDLAFSTIYNYEMDLMEYIAEHYPNLDGLQIEEPLYPYTQSYSTAMRDRVKAKYGYDPLYMPEADMRPIINAEMTAVMSEFFTELRTKITAANPSLQLSANGLHYYSAHTGFNPAYMAQNGLLDWYAAQIYRDNLAAWQSGIQAFNSNVSGIPLCAIAGIQYALIKPNDNTAFLSQMEHVYEYGMDIGGVFTYHYRDHIVDGGQVADVGLHNMVPTAATNEPPVLGAIGDKTVDESSLLQFTVTATDPESDPMTFSTGTLPTGATFNAGTQVFSWTPSVGQAGVYSLQFEVTDGDLIDSETIAISVNTAVKHYITVEAENAYEVAAVLAVTVDTAASNGSCITSPEGSAFNAPGHAKYNVNIPAQGNYKICGLVLGADGNSNSFYVDVDDGTAAKWPIPIVSVYEWDDVSNWGTGTESAPETDPVIYALTSGNHVITVKHRESGAKLDKLVVTNDLTYVPTEDPVPVASFVHDGAVCT